MVIPAPLTSADPRQQAIRRGLQHLVSLQGEDGSWRGCYGGPMFLLPMYVAACHICGHPIPADRRRRIIAYLCSVQRPDGSVGLHEEARGSMFCSVLSYVALRLLRVPPELPEAARMRRWIRENGTALGCAAWGKLTLAVLNLYDYKGLHPVLPELWLLPYRLPIHPGRLWCHCRQVYLPMASLYGMRSAAPEDGLVRQLRQEIYDQPYHQIPWTRHRDTLAPADGLVPLTREARAAFKLMGVFDRWHLPFLRQRALTALAEHLDYEDRATHFIRIGPVNAVLNTLVHHFRDPGGPGVARSFETLDGYLWEDEQQTQMNGYNSTALWDTAFATQAILATSMAGEQRQALERAHGYIEQNQVLEELPSKEQFFRHSSRGGWPFSDRQHGWPITDCTAEGLKCALALQGLVQRPIESWRLEAAARLILSFQNRDGGWATYELQRGGSWLERLNPSQVFERIMVDYSYVECSSACIQALTAARPVLSPELQHTVDAAVRRGERFIRKQQRQDGSWEGSWGVCFTYGTWFGVWGLAAAGAVPGDPALDRACSFLLRHQNPDGGWGEHFDSCTRRRYVNHDQSHPVQTAWALMALARAGQGDTPEARRAADWLVQAQEPSGDWPHQALVGVFNRTTLIRYDNYRRYFPIWALSLLGA